MTRGVALSTSSSQRLNSSISRGVGTAAENSSLAVSVEPAPELRKYTGSSFSAFLVSSVRCIEAISSSPRSDKNPTVDMRGVEVQAAPQR